MSNGKRILIVGGVAGGASCAARARRLSEESKIVLFERGPYVSFANCGLPYHVGDVIRKEENLLVATPELFRKRFNIEVRPNSEVMRIHRATGRIEVKDLTSGETYLEEYDSLVLSPGAEPLRPPIPGIEMDGVFTLRTIPDSRRMRDWITRFQARRAVIVGGGFIGLEMAENLVKRGLSVTIVEMQPHVMPLLDPEMTAQIHAELKRNGVALHLGETVSGLERDGEAGLCVRTAAGIALQADVVILAVGVRPEVGLAREAGLEIGELGGIRVDEHMRTSDKRIWAVGDAVEVKDFVTGRWTLLPLAGPANRQGRIAADVIFGKSSKFRGVQGTAVVGIFDLTVASTGPSEKHLKRYGLWGESLPYEKIYIHPGQHAGYYPGASLITLKLIFAKEDGRIIGAQAVGKEGVEKRIDVLSMAIQKQGTVFDLEEAELCYAPQYGSAKDPVNMAGMVAANVLRGDASMIHCEDMGREGAFVLDVRSPFEFKQGHLEGAVNIPLDDLRERIGELPKDRDIHSYCLVGQRSYYAARALLQRGFKAKNLCGGLRLYHFCKEAEGLG